MRNVRSSILNYLRNQLDGVKLWNIRHDKESPESSLLHDNAVNIEFVFDRPGVAESNLQIAIDVIYEDEYEALEVVGKIWKILGATEAIPLLDFETDFLNPTSLGYNLRWSSRTVKFSKIADNSSRYSCHLLLTYTDPSMLS